MPDQITFYTNPMSRGRIVRWMLEETGVPYETELLDYATTMKQAAYLAINPMGKVPAIVHNRRIITECAAICTYLADTFPDAGLAPPVSDRADYYRWLFFAAGPLELAATNHSLGVEVAPEKTATVGYGTFELTIDVLEKALTGKQFIAGDRFSAADVYVGSHVNFGLQFGWMPKRQAFLDYSGGLTERTAFRRANEIDSSSG